MKMDAIMKLIGDLACSQGFYGRLREEIQSLSAEDYEDLKQELEAQNFKDGVEFVLYVEG